MDDIQKRAHDFALTAMQCYQAYEIAEAQRKGTKLEYDLIKLKKAYDDAFLEMEYRLNEEKDQFSNASNLNSRTISGRM